MFVDDQFDKTAKWVCLNGTLVEKTSVRISPFDRGYLFADGVYEGVGFVAGRMIDNKGHFARLHNSLAALEIIIPWSEADIVSMQQQLLDANACQEGFCYYQISRGVADRDFYFPQSAHAQLFMFLQPKALLDNQQAEQGIQVICVPDWRWARRSIKTIALLPQVLAKQQAHVQGKFEAWLVENGEVTEGSSTSAFIVNSKGELQTAPLSERILPGVTRRAVLELARQQGVPIREQHFTPEDAYQAREAFITSASSLVTPVVGVDDQAIADSQPGEITTLLRKLYIEHYCS